MTKFIKPFISLYRLYAKIKNLKLAYRLLPNVYTPQLNSTAECKNGVYSFDNYPTTLSEKQLELFENDGELLRKFIQSTNIHFSSVDSNKLSVHINNTGIDMIISDRENLKVIEEIFIDLLYDFRSKDQYAVLDVGMNMGAASLYFASFDNVQKVYGYEPFPATFEMAKQNLDLNNSLSQKITIFNYGLGKADEEISVPEPAGGSLGGTTTDFAIKELPANLQQGKQTKVQIKNISSAIKQARHDNPSLKILLKLDCEGAEYDILDELSRSGGFDQIDVLMIEFHFKGKKSLIRVLEQQGYFVLSPAAEINLFGMVYAFKQPI